MSDQLRFRSTGLNNRNDNNGVSAAVSSSTSMLNNYDESLLSARALLAASPTHSSPVMKIHIPAIYAFLPATIQWILMRFCPKNWTPRWKRRYLIAVGEYIYRFKDENDTCPKGAPIPVIMTDVRILSKRDVDDNDDEALFQIALELLPVGYDAVFKLSSVGKTQYFAVESREEANIWVHTLRQMRQDAISRSMGHTHGSPYPNTWKMLDTSAKRLKEKKIRIKNKLEELNRKEQEMQTLGGSGIVGGNLGYFN